MNIKRFFAFTMIMLALTGLAFSQQNVLQLQLRSRGKDPEAAKSVAYIRGRAIQYQTVQWNPAETVLFCNLDTIGARLVVASGKSPRDTKQLEHIAEVVDHAKTLGIRIQPHLARTGKDPVFSRDDKDILVLDETVKNVVFLVDRLTPEAYAMIDKVVQSGKNVAVFRDMISYDVAADDAALQKRDEEIKRLESERCPTIDSCDWLGKPAFRFEDDKRPHVAFLVSDDHYHAEKTLPVFAEEFAAERGFYTTIMHGEGTNSFGHTAELSTVDVLVVFVRRLAPPKEQLDRIREYVASGRGGVIGMRTASHAFDSKGDIPKGHDNWVEFDRDVLGGSYHNHGRNDIGTDVAPAQNASGVAVDSPVLKGVEPQRWHSAGSLYWTAPIKEDATLLQTGSSEEGQNEPLTWLRQHGQTRVAYTGLGYQDDFEVEAFRKLLANLICWASQKQ